MTCIIVLWVHIQLFCIVESPRLSSSSSRQTWTSARSWTSLCTGEKGTQTSRGRYGQSWQYYVRTWWCSSRRSRFMGIVLHFVREITLTAFLNTKNLMRCMENLHVYIRGQEQRKFISNIDIVFRLITSIMKLCNINFIWTSYFFNLYDYIFSIMFLFCKEPLVCDNFIHNISLQLWSFLIYIYFVSETIFKRS